MSTESTSPENDANLSDLGRAMLGGDSAASRPSSKPSAVWEPPTADELHKLLPQYEIVKMLGRGGMGAVYMGRQISLDRPVAIKILSATLGDADVGFSERFKNEARAMAKLNHPGIVSVYDFGETEGGLLYIVMEYVDGTDVARMIAANGRLHTEHAMAITAHVCDALSYAHERGIIHRDIKPANIMVAYDGSVKVADFGLAKVSTANGSTMGLTQSGMAMGTLHFMAPEALVLGSSVDHRADIYAVGVMLFQMLTGKLPHGMFELPSIQVKGLDPRYDGIIARSMREDREARYQSASELRRDLDAILTQPVQKIDESAKPALSTQARPQRPGGRPPQPPRSRVEASPTPHRSLAWLWLLLIACAGGAVWYLLPQSPAPVAAAPSPVVDPKPAPPPPQVDPLPVVNTAPTPAVNHVVTAPVVTPSSTPKPEVDSEGWTSLFNGKDLNGWEASPPNFPAKVIGGMLKIEGVAVREDAGHLFYVGDGSLSGKLPDWKNFELITTLKTLRMGNSGLRIHSRPISREMNINASGPEINIWNEGMSAPADKDHRTGGIPRIAVVPVSYFKDGEWFEMKIRVEKDTHLQVSLRREGEAIWTQAVDWTQPANWMPSSNPNARLSSGTIAFSNWVPADGEVWVREVKLRSLDAQTSSTMPTVAKGSGLEPKTLEEALLNYTWEWTHAPLPPDQLTFQREGIATCPRFFWHWKITGPRTVLAYDSTDASGKKEPSFKATLQFDETFSTLQAFNDTGTRHFSGKRLELIRTDAMTASLSGSTFGGHRYQFVPGSLTWSEAKAKAEIMGGHLATITSKEENEWLMNTFKSQLSSEATPQNARMVWLGGIEDNLGAGWKWVTGEPFQFTAWMQGEPNREKGGRGQIGHPFMLNFYSGGKEIGWNDNSADPVLASKMGGFLVEWETDKSGAIPTPAIPLASTTLWIDTKGRSLQAEFVRLEGSNVLLDIAGKVTPVPLATLSAASQQQAMGLQPGISTPVRSSAPAPPAAPSPAPTPASSFLVYSDDFDDGAISPAWRQDGAAWHCLGGMLTTTKEGLQEGGDKGGGIWLMRDLPVNFRVQFKLMQADQDEAQIICELAGRPASSGSQMVPGYRIHFEADPKTPQMIKKGSFTLPSKAMPQRGKYGRLNEHVVIERRDGKTLEYRNGNLLKAQALDSTPIPTGWLGFHFVKGSPLVDDLRIYDLDQGTPPPVSSLNAEILQSQSLTGQLKDQRNKPVGGAIVRLIDSTPLVTKTDALGRFSFKRFPAGNFSLRAECIEGEAVMEITPNHPRRFVALTLKTTRTYGIRWVHQTKPGSLSLEGEGTVVGEAWFSNMHNGFVMSRGGPPDSLVGATRCDFSIVMNGRKVTFGNRHGSAAIARLERVPFGAILAVDQGGPLDKQGYFPNPLKFGDNLSEGDVFTVRNETDGTYGKVEIMHIPN